MMFEIDQTVVHWVGRERKGLLRVSLLDPLTTNDGREWLPDGRGEVGRVLPAAEIDIRHIEHAKMSRRLRLLLNWMIPHAAKLTLDQQIAFERTLIGVAREALNASYASYETTTRGRLIQDRIDFLVSELQRAESGD